MRFNIEVGQLLKSFEHINPIVNKKTTKEVLSYIKFSASGNHIVLQATDLEIELQESLLVNQMLEEGEALILASIVYETLKKLPASQLIEFNLTGHKIDINCGNFNSSLATIDIASFPRLNTSQELQYSLSVAEMKKLFERTKFATSNDESRYYLNGIYLHTLTNNELPIMRAVATDGHRLAISDINNTTNLELPNGIIIPKKTIDIIGILISKYDDQTIVKIASDDKMIYFDINNINLNSKLIDANYPNYLKVIPENNTYLLSLQRSDILNALELVSMYCDDKLKYVNFMTKNQELTIKATMQSGGAEHKINLNEATDEINISFNARYLSEICKLIKNNIITIRVLDANTPALIQDPNEATELFVVMPMKF